MVEMTDHLIGVSVETPAGPHDLGPDDARHKGDGKLVSDARNRMDAQGVHTQLRLEDGELRLGGVA